MEEAAKWNIMNKIKSLVLAIALFVAGAAQAQFSQALSDYEYMFKVEAGYAPYVSNLGHPGEYGYYINDLRHTTGINVINGVCIKQDFFVGLGLGYNYVAAPSHFKNGWHSAMAFIDFDFRPLDVEFAPMIIGKLGASYMMGDTPYGNTIAPYAEVGLGINWYYNHVLSNMERNNRSIFLEVAFAYTQQTTFLPVRMGWRF